jgi:DnaJ like chaperone protein
VFYDQFDPPCSPARVEADKSMGMMFTPKRITLGFMAVFGLGGAFMGIPALIMGIILGYFAGGLYSQLRNDKAVLAYFENPGPSAFYEGEPGLAAFCALGAYLMSRASPKVLENETAAVRIAGGAVSVFPEGKKIGPLAESFCRMAYKKLSALNPDLLTESLAARRREKGDLSLIGLELGSMASGREAQQEALYIRQFLEPNYEPAPDEIPGENPWLVLDIPRGAPYEEVKSAFRKLALACHPDNQSGVDEAEKQRLEEQFIRVRDAYRTIIRDYPPHSPTTASSSLS